MYYLAILKSCDVVCFASFQHEFLQLGDTWSCMNYLYVKLVVFLLLFTYLKTLFQCRDLQDRWHNH